MRSIRGIRGVGGLIHCGHLMNDGSLHMSLHRGHDSTMGTHIAVERRHAVSCLPGLVRVTPGAKLRQDAHGAMDGIDVDPPFPSTRRILVQIGHRECPKRRVNDVLRKALEEEQRIRQGKKGREYGINNEGRPRAGLSVV